MKDVLILIVDDNPENIKVLGNTLENEKYDIAIAKNGQEALNFLYKEKPDLILLDIMMPDINGFDVCERIKKNETLKHIPVIFLTAKQDTDDIVRGFDVGGVDYITKPFNPRELIARVNTHVSLKKANDEIYKLRGLIPICANCKKIRDDKGFWTSVESYIEKNSDVKFTHGICPECNKKLYGSIIDD